jgi:hypothetical protein
VTDSQLRQHAIRLRQAEMRVEEERVAQSSFAPKCKELALYFLKNHHFEIDNQNLDMDVLIKQLAIEIQRTVEDFISNRFD